MTENYDEDFDEDDKLENIVEPDAVIEYIFIEKADKQIKPINDDQGYSMGFFNIFITGKFKNINKFKSHILFDEWFEKYTNRI